jgi:hypothetical protein
MGKSLTILMQEKLCKEYYLCPYQNGRMKAINNKDREEIASILKTNGDNLAKSIKKIKEYSEANNQKIDYILFGDIAEVEIT